MCAHAALLALSEEPCQYVRNWVIRVSDLQSTGPAPERIPATVTVRISMFGILGD